MRFGSVCSGIDAASVAWGPLGWKAAFFSEIEPFPSAVLAHHYPDVPNLGDMTRFQEWPDAALDLLVGGTPCQPFSVAGLRQGLADPRGNLALTYLGIADRFRPKRLIWENVPGALSVDGGRAFGAFIGGLAKLGYGFAWRVLDAQFVRVDGFGRAVPQRRRRVFVVGYLGDWRRAAAVLFERASLSGDPPPRREARQDVAPTLSARTKGGGGLGTDAELDGALIAHGGGNTSGPIDVAACLTAKGQRVDFEVETFVTTRPVAATLTRGAESAGRGGYAGRRQEDDDNLVAHAQPTVCHGWAVRRLTPTECERLQGFPDGYTAIPYRGKPAADGPRYKALGNSMAVNVMRWLGRRIEMVDGLTSDQKERAA